MGVGGSWRAGGGTGGAAGAVRHGGGRSAAEQAVVAGADAQAHFFPRDGVDLFEAFHAQVFVQTVVDAERIHGIGHGFDVPIVGFDALVEDFGATTLVGDDGRHAALHGFEGRDAEGFGHRGHDIDVGVAEHLVDFAPFHEAGEVEAVGDAAPRREFDHGLHHIARTGEAEADVARAFEHEGGGFDEILGAFLHGDAAQEGHHLLLSLGSGAALRHDLADVVGKGVDGVVHRHHFCRVLPVVVDDGAAGEFRNAHDAVGMVHAVALNGVDRGVDIAARAVEIRGVDVHHQRLSAHLLGVDARGIGEPVVGMDDVILLLSGNDTRHDGVVVDLFLQIVGIAARKLDATQVVGEPIGEIGVDVVAQGEILFGRHAIAEALAHIVVVHVAPHDGSFAQPDDVHETFVLVAPGLGDAEGDVHVGLCGQAGGHAVGRGAEPAEDVGREFPAKHEYFHGSVGDRGVGRWVGSVAFGGFFFEAVLLELAEGAQDAAHVHGKRDGAATREGRVAVEEFGNRADAVVEEFFFEADELPLDVVHAAHAVDAQVGLEVEAREPRPGGALVVGAVAIFLTARVVGRVALAFGREGADALGRFEFAGADVEHGFALPQREGREVEGDGQQLVGPNAPVGVAPVDVVEEIAAVVDKGGAEALFKLSALGLDAFGGDEAFGAAVVDQQLLVELFGVVIQGVELDDVARAGHDGPTPRGGVHPRHGAVATVGIDQAVGVAKEVGVAAFEDERHDAVDEGAVALATTFATHVFGILLQAPHGPEQRVGLFGFVDLHAHRAPAHEVVERAGGGVHVFFELFGLADGQRQAGHGDEGVAGAGFEPRVARDDVVQPAELLAELVGGVHQRVVERVARVVGLDFVGDQRFERRGVAGVERGGEHNALAPCDGHLEIARHEEVFRLVVAAFTLFGVVQPPIPVGRVMVDRGRAVELHHQVGIALIEIERHALFDGVGLGARRAVLVRPLAHGAEGQEGAQSQRGGRVGLEQRVANEQPVALVAEDDLLFQHHTADAIDPRGHFVPLEALDVFVAAGTEIVAHVFVQAEVELRAVLHHGFVERGEQHVVFVVESGHGHHKQPVVFADVAPRECGRAVGARLVGEQEFLHEGFLQVGHLRFVETKEGHRRAVGAKMGEWGRRAGRHSAARTRRGAEGRRCVVNSSRRAESKNDDCGRY